MKNELQNQTRNDAPEKTPDADEASWDALYERIRELASKRADAMAGRDVDDEDAFDRGARSLRTLMGAAEISRRMKTADAKEIEPDESAKEPVISDARIEEVYRAVAQSVDRVAEGVEEEAGRRGDISPGLSGTGGETVETERS